jgi:serine phosphatase RsbU (regulator of sigma subunit)
MVERRMQAELPGDRELTALLSAAAYGRQAAGAVPSWLAAPSRLRVIPLRARGRVIGSISLVNSGSGGPRPLADPPVLEALAAHAAITIDNALFYAKRSADVAALQRGLLPASLPAVPVFELAAYYAPGDRSLEVGGDFYDAVSLADDHVALVIGDVCGSGADAASLTGPARAVLRTVLEDGASPARALARLNHAMFDFNDDVKFCTAAVIEVRGAGHGEFRLRVASGGHPLPLLRRDGRVAEIGEAGPFLGVLESVTIPERTLMVRADDLILMYTDGVIEARHDNEMFEVERLMATVGAADLAVGGILAAVAGAVAEFRNRGSDDIAMLALRVKELRLTVNQDPASARSTRA